MLCDRLRDLLAGDLREREPVVCDVSRLVANLEAVDALARLELAARRLGGGITISGASRLLDELIARCGLSSVIRSTVPDPRAARPQSDTRAPPG
jgi:hypothetical protein